MCPSRATRGNRLPGGERAIVVHDVHDARIHRRKNPSVRGDRVDSRRFGAGSRRVHGACADEIVESSGDDRARRDPGREDSVGASVCEPVSAQITLSPTIQSRLSDATRRQLRIALRWHLYGSIFAGLVLGSYTVLTVAREGEVGTFGPAGLFVAASATFALQYIGASPLGLVVTLAWQQLSLRLVPALENIVFFTVHLAGAAFTLARHSDLELLGWHSVSTGECRCSHGPPIGALGSRMGMPRVAGGPPRPRSFLTRTPQLG